MEKKPDRSFRVHLTESREAVDARRLGMWWCEQSDPATGGAADAGRGPEAGPIDRSVIRSKRRSWLPVSTLASHAVSPLPPTSEQPHGYHRLIGGSVELGETHRDAIAREVHEELSTTVRDLTSVDVVENIFRGEAPMQLDPGDFGCYWQLGPEVTA